MRLPTKPAKKMTGMLATRMSAKTSIRERSNGRTSQPNTAMHQTAAATTPNRFPRGATPSALALEHSLQAATKPAARELRPVIMYKPPDPRRNESGGSHSTTTILTPHSTNAPAQPARVKVLIANGIRLALMPMFAISSVRGHRPRDSVRRDFKSLPSIEVIQEAATRPRACSHPIMPERPPDYGLLTRSSVFVRSASLEMMSCTRRARP